MDKSDDIFIDHLKQVLPGSDAEERTNLAIKIIKEDIHLGDLLELLHCNRKIALRFQWLISDIGTTNPERLINVLPVIFEMRNEIFMPEFHQAFATWWSICGVPNENEAEAITLLFILIKSSQVNVTIKGRAIKALLPLAENYPELKPELILTLETQLK